MARAFGIILLVMALACFVAPISLQAQHHGGGGARSGGSVASRPSASFGPVAPFRSSPVTGFGRAPGINSRPIVRSARPVVVAPIYGYGYGYGYYPPYDSYSPYYGYGAGPGYVEPDYSDQQPVYVPGPEDVQQQPSSQSDADLSYQVGRLTQEVEQLRQQQAASQQAPSAPASMPVVLVFRDGHRTEIQNYAIIGPTLWVLDNRTTKIPLSDLDLDATQKENQARGMRFSVPSR